MMDFTSIISIIIAIAIICFFIKFVVNPVIKVILGIAFFLILIYLVQRFFNFNLDQIPSPFNKYLNTNNLNWILGPANYCIDQIKNILNIK